MTSLMDSGYFLILQKSVLPEWFGIGLPLFAAFIRFCYQCPQTTILWNHDFPWISLAWLIDHLDYKLWGNRFLRISFSIGVPTMIVKMAQGSNNQSKNTQKETDFNDGNEIIGSLWLDMGQNAGEIANIWILSYCQWEKRLTTFIVFLRY